ncbi:MAG: hypothetical protein V4671_12995 [Armatimonadota bacterium]
MAGWNVEGLYDGFGRGKDFVLKQSSEFRKKTPLRLLTLLLASTFIVCGFLLYRAQSIGAATASASTDTLKGLKLSEDVRVRMPDIYTLDSTDTSLSKKRSHLSDAPRPGKSSQPGLREDTSHLKKKTAIVRSVARQLRQGAVPFVPLPRLAEDGYGFEPASEEQKKAGRVWLGIKLFCLDGKYVGRVRLEIEQPLSDREFVTLWSTESHREFVTTSEKDASTKTDEAIREVVDAFIYEYLQSNNLPEHPAPAGPHWADSSRFRYIHILGLPGGSSARF